MSSPSGRRPGRSARRAPCCRRPGSGSATGTAPGSGGCAGRRRPCVTWWRPRGRTLVGVVEARRGGPGRRPRCASRRARSAAPGGRSAAGRDARPTATSSSERRRARVLAVPTCASRRPAAGSRRRARSARSRDGPRRGSLAAVAPAPRGRAAPAGRSPRTRRPMSAPRRTHLPLAAPAGMGFREAQPVPQPKRRAPAWPVSRAGLSAPSRR